MSKFVQRRGIVSINESAVPLAALVLCLISVFMVSMRIVGYGFHPVDDALRHVAKVVSGKGWSEILLLRPEITMDSHPGWHWILELFLRFTSGTPDDMLVFSVVALFLLVNMIPAFFFNRPEAWVLSLTVMVLVSFGPLFRTLYGRPFILSMFAVVVFCFTWKWVQEGSKTWLSVGLYCLVLTLSTFIHGAWYLFLLPLAALALARRWRALLFMTGATATGVCLGALLTGKPLMFLHQMTFHALEAFGQHDVVRQLVTEFRPFDGAPFVMMAVAMLLLWHLGRGAWDAKLIDNPVFYLGVMGWMLGFVAGRFWTDWGWVGITVWCALVIEQILQTAFPPASLRRLLMAALACLAFFLALSNDRDSRWTGTGLTPWPEMSNPEQRPWLPEESGILYNDSMFLFYNVFYRNPHGPWRYALGFEPIWMPKEDLTAYRRIQLSPTKPESYRAWIEKMTKKDRIMLIRTSKPDIPGVEWHEVVPTVWSGRLPLPSRHPNADAKQ